LFAVIPVTTQPPDRLLGFDQVQLSVEDAE